MTTTYDYWHIRRYLGIQGMADDVVLPFGRPPVMIGNVVCIWEPVWRTAVATARSLGVPDVFEGWRWERPLSPRAAAAALPAMRAALDVLRKTRVVTHAAELAEDSLPEVDAIITALQALHDLFALAVRGEQAIEIWAE